MQLTDKGREVLAQAAHRHGFSPDAARAMLAALARGGGRQAQFDHPEFGGMGQWSGGMLMIGNIFDTALKARVGALIADLSEMAASIAPAPQDAAAQDWPSELGTPSSSGAQNDMRYAVFPASRRLAVRRGGKTVLYDTGDHRIGSVSQQQGTGDALFFTSQHGPVPLDSLVPVDLPGPKAAQDAAPSQTSIPALIEQLHDLLSRGILTQAEFDAKKAELLRGL